MDAISLTETEFSRKLTDGENDNLHVAYKNFVHQVSEVRIQIQYKPLSVECLN